MVTHISWNEAIKGYLIHDQAVDEPKTLIYHRTHLTAIARWAASQGIELNEFGKRAMDQYTVLRKAQGTTVKTRRHDFTVMHTFIKWCVHNDILERDLLHLYKPEPLPKREKTSTPKPDMTRLFEVALEFWDHRKKAQPECIP
jgi:site-specific recombinase XerD